MIEEVVMSRLKTREHTAQQIRFELKTGRNFFITGDSILRVAGDDEASS
jgi:hypothetical protein